MPSREYKPEEKPRLGDVIQVFEGTFGQGIITSITESEIIVERVHMSCSTSGREDIGQIQLGIERISYYNKRGGWPRPYLEKAGGRIENRKRD